MCIRDEDSLKTEMCQDTGPMKHVIEAVRVGNCGIVSYLVGWEEKGIAFHTFKNCPNLHTVL